MATSILDPDEAYRVVTSDCIEFLQSLPDDSVDLFVFSPPYEDCRRNLGFAVLKGQAWVDWMVRVFVESRRVCRGLVACVCEGKTRKFAWSATPALLMADLHRGGFKLRKPPAYCRSGIFGSGGKDWFRNDYEFVVCTSRGRLPWSENTACGHPPKWAPGGEPSYRTLDGQRVNAVKKLRRGARGYSNGDMVTSKSYKPPKIANPGNLIRCKVGGGLMGHALAHENEAPFPLTLAERFVRSCCPPGGITCDPFAGSGTTLHACIQWGRRFVGCDVRAEQVRICVRRAKSITPMMLK